MTTLRSVLFFVWFLVVSVAMHIAALPTLVLPRKAIVRTAQGWSRLVVASLKPLVGLSYEVRGRIPAKGEGVLIAAKHMSMWDTLALYMLVDDPIVVLKKELKSIPFYGWFANHADMIFVDRKGGASALRDMTTHAARALAEGRALIIFPEGTRKTPDEPPDYKPGIAGLYNQLKLPCVPVALNSGLFWKGFRKSPGKIVVEFLDAIPPGLKRAEFMRVLEDRVESATTALVEEGRRCYGVKIS